MRPTPYHGLLVLDKPAGMTSRDAVDRAQRWFPRGTRIGHTGTLDPLATGVLVLCVGAATRLTEYVQAMAKTYIAGVRLGGRSDSDDADGTITPAVVAAPPVREEVERCLRTFVGEIEQVPPAYSAAKVTGRRAYALARRGEEVDLRPRRVRIYGIDVLAYEYPRLDLEVRCGKGTYIRSLARDLGERLGCGGYIETLRRMRVGPFAVEDAVSLDATAEEARKRLLPLRQAVAELPAITLSAPLVRRLRAGQEVECDLDFKGISPEEVAVLDKEQNLVAVGRWRPGRKSVKPEKVFPAPGGDG